MLNLSRRFADLRIRDKLLISYSALFLLWLSICSAIMFFFLKESIQANIESELKNTTQTILNMVRTSASVSIKNHLRAVAEKNREIAQHFYDQALAGKISMEAAKRQTREVMLSQTIGKTGYIYCIDSQGIIRIHPENALIDVDLSNYAFITEQMARKEGYLEYNWKNPGETHPRPKALYMTYFKPWDWIISVTSYRNEFRELVNVDDFRDSILSIVFGQTGYSYVLDLEGNLIIHPSLEGNYLDATDVNGRHFIQEICKRKSGKIIYSWAMPGEGEAREKLVIFNYIPEYQWIVASSSFLEEFYAPLRTIGHLILAMVITSFVMVLPITSRISSSITNPLLELMDRFASGAKGDISVRLKPRSRDEVGTLATYFNTFMEQLEASSQSLKTTIAESRKAEQEMARMRHYLKHFVDALPSVLVGVDRDGRVTQWNRGAERMTGVDDRQALGREVTDLLPLLLPYGEMIDAAIQEGRARHVEKALCADGQRSFFADIMVYPIEAGSMRGAVIRVDDVTQRVHMENVMVQTEKMMSVGGLAAGMAHEINNPLGGMLQSLQNVIRRLSPGLAANEADAVACGTQLETIRCYLERRDIFRFLENIRISGERASRIVENMLSFSRRSESHKTSVELAVLLDKAVELAAHDYDLKKKFDFRHIRIERRYEADLPPVPCVATEIEQVIFNLLRNAAQAMGEAGEHRQAPCITLDLHREKEFAVIEIADNGPGMDEARRNRIFEPFFTTKEVGVGTGLGLSVAYFIVTNNHNGFMTAESSPGKGANFIIRLPLMHPLNKTPEPKNMPVPSAEERGRAH
ncbi:putative Histidine kinase [Desulfosarcina cetonica]|uniref:cache domain-containing protein n=1 Tax=Desulfosarcina cetonica TaxID=90730 RepID=UPI0006D05FB6|nr:cache domain-containing protein [Desulfosarcina cetonica]VTR68648.1 putative Histidine kinase [Desulfosarcina cetonica]